MLYTRPLKIDNVFLYYFKQETQSLFSFGFLEVYCAMSSGEKGNLPGSFQ